MPCRCKSARRRAPLHSDIWRQIFIGLIVCKFGGTSTASAGMLKRIREILERNPDRRYAVLSAPGADGTSPRVTDLLRRCWQLRQGGGNVEPLISEVIARFHSISDGLGIPDKDDAIRRELERALATSEADTMSRGEYLITRLFCGYTGLPMADAAGLIKFDLSGRLDEARTTANLTSMARRLPRAVIPGFYGSDPFGAVVTLPRNGSDITGALVAAGVGATLYENWTDVPGLMTADPALDPGAKLIPRIRYRDMHAFAGAQVLHPDSLTYVDARGIPTRLAWTAHPDLPGTLISG